MKNNPILIAFTGFTDFTAWQTSLPLGEIHNYALPNPQRDALVLLQHIIQVRPHFTALQVRFDEVDSDLSLIEGAERR